MKTLQFTNSIYLSPLRSGLILLATMLTCFVLSPPARAVVPPPDGGYPNDNTAEGDNALFSLTTGMQNTAIGSQALYSDTTGPQNTATGAWALFSNTTADSNTADGWAALYSNTTGLNNTGVGWGALYSNATGGDNTAIGNGALYYNTDGVENTAVGSLAVLSNTTGFDNTGIGTAALMLNTTGVSNTATGTAALYYNTVGSNNTATGREALHANTTGDLNTATGTAALGNSTSGTRNTGTGVQTLELNTTGNRNTATGYSALFFNTTGNHNTAHGWIALFNETSGNLNTAVGDAAGYNLTTGDNNIYIANQGVAAESNTIRIGNQVATMLPDGSPQAAHAATFIAGIYGVGVNGVPVKINAAGQLGTPPSAARFKDEIKPMDKASEALLALKPVTFRYKKEIDPERTQQFGLVAEDVETINPDLVARDADGKIYTVRYEAVNAMLLNEFLKEHRTVQEQKATIAQLKKNFAEQRKQIEALTTGLEKVSAQFELRRRAPLTIVDND